MLVSGSIPNLYNGVSQQTPSMRLATQAEESVNFFPSLVSGLVKRPPMKYAYTLPDYPTSQDSKIYFYNRDVDHQYIFTFTYSEVGYVHVFIKNLKTGETVGFSAECIGLTSIEDLGIFSIADYIFYWNKKLKVILQTDYISTIPGRQALVYFKQISYDTTYSCTVTAISTTGSKSAQTLYYTTPKNIGTVDNPPETLSTEEALNAFKAGFSQYFSNRLSIYTHSSVMYLETRDGSSIDVQVTDTRNNNELKCLMDKVQSFSDLPNEAVENYYVEVTGDQGSGVDNYYARFLPDADTSSYSNPLHSGVWVETVKHGMRKGVNPMTGPWAIKRYAHLGDTAFTALRNDWAQREVGDEDSAPDPLFIDRTISDMFLFRNRLGILSDDSVTLSEAGDMFNFYPKTVLTVTDSDPISVSASGKSVTNLLYAVPFQDSLVVFGPDTQFIMETQDILSPSTATLKVTTAYAADLSAAPVNGGGTLFFCVPSSGFLGVREYYTDNDSLSKLAPSITAHVPKYIKGTVRILTVSNTEDVLIVGTTAHDSRLYMYKYYWSGADKLQAAWSKLEFPDDIRVEDATFFESTLYMAVRDLGSGLRYVCAMDFSANAVSTIAEDGEGKAPYIDWAAQVTLTTPDNGENIYVNAPYVAGDNTVVVNTNTMRCFKTISAPLQNQPLRRRVLGVTLGDLSQSYVVGSLYESRYVFSEQFPKVSENKETLFAGRLRFLEWMLVYGPSANFRVEVEKDTGQIYTYPFNGTVLGKHDALLGSYKLFSGEFKFPVKGLSKRARISVINDTHLPCALLSAEWEGNYQTRSRRM
jgi:hypothetical protein